MLTMDQPFVLQPVGPSPRWVLHPPTDPYGDGYIWDVRSDIIDDGVSAQTSATLLGGRATPEDDSDLYGFFERLSDDWRGWEGVREWRSLEGEMSIDARHDGRGHVATA
jgi:hypothetical protein